MAENRLISRYISMIYRLGNPYFDNKLEAYHIGCGQQFFLLHISENPGISFQELAAIGHYGKGTATRAVQKLEREGYVRWEVDQEDKRVRHLYLNEKAEPVIKATWKVVDNWVGILTDNFTRKEKEDMEAMLARMVDNALTCTDR